MIIFTGTDPYRPIDGDVEEVCKFVGVCQNAVQNGQPCYCVSWKQGGVSYGTKHLFRRLAHRHLERLLEAHNEYLLNKKANT